MQPCRNPWFFFYKDRVVHALHKGHGPSPPPKKKKKARSCSFLILSTSPLVKVDLLKRRVDQKYPTILVAKVF